MITALFTAGDTALYALGWCLERIGCWLQNNTNKRGTT